MLRLSRKTLLALEAVVDVALNARPNPVQSKDITRRQGIPQRYLEQVMQQLVRTGVLKGVRGPRGGYRLARERRLISVGEIVQIVSSIEAAEDLQPGPSELGQKVVGPLWEQVQNNFLLQLNAITIEDLCRKADATGVSGTNAAHTDFTI